MTQPAPLQARQPFKPSEFGPPPISAVLLQLIYGLVIPLFTAGISPDLNDARLAAIELVQSYRPRTQPELVLVAKIVAFGLAALDSLRTSMAPDQAVTLKLRLRTNAVALERLVGKNTDTLDRIRSVSQPRPAQPLDPWTAADEVDLQGMMENARTMIEAANADLALARAEMTSQASDVLGVAGTHPVPASPAQPEPQADPVAEAQPATPEPAFNTPEGESPVTGRGVAQGPAAPHPVAARQAVAPQTAAPQLAAPGTTSKAIAPSAAQASPVRATIAAPKPDTQTSLTQEQEYKLLWADAMTAVAKEFTSHPDDADPMLRKADAMRASVLGSVASELAAQVKGLQSGGGD